MTKKIILDIDTGVDDSMALAYAVGCPDIDLIGVVGTYGNVYTDQGVQNVLNLLHMLGKNDIPVFAGESKAIYEEIFDRLDISAKIHGENGVGQANVPISPNKMQDISGIDFIIDSINKFGSELTIVATGPMTNLGKAILKDPSIASKVGKIVIMGGALTVPGNVNSFTEANISQDPEAAKILFESEADITMVGLDVTMRSVLTLNDTDRWRKTNTISGKTYSQIVDYYIHIHDEIAPFLNGCPLHDPSAIIASVHPEYFHMLPLFMTVELEGSSRGRTIANMSKIRDINPNVKVCINVEEDKILKELCTTLENLFSN